MNDAGNPWVSRPVAPEASATTETPQLLLSPASGPLTPHRGGVPAPDRVDQLPTVKHPAAAELWVVGTHGGAGESSLAALSPRWAAAGHGWPLVEGATQPSARVVLAARSNLRGLRSAQAAATQWAAGLVPFVEVVGLVVVADAPGRLPRPLRDFAKVVSGGVPRTWHVGWIEPWRLGEPVSVETAPRDVRRLTDELHTLVGAGTTGT
ncbi:hypothetical protein DT076_07905 [Desertihabitans brevis]|uniref:Uncharacterized protein n=1 Tax=Desertihabitans brevis TaxID=2268447 RepID=A0A367YW24_9ACTN|nr:DUF6668 family protein [Desertihabitans brevis]RCK69937.1 hypothetical protein DT076_07905 [Desertihabitans brevis]